MSAFTYQKGDVIGFAVDMTDKFNPIIYVYKNNKLQHVSTISTDGSDLIPFATMGGSGADQNAHPATQSSSVTFGTIPEIMSYPVPEGFEALELTGPLEKTEYMSTMGYITDSSTLPANQAYPDVITNVPILKKDLEISFVGNVKQSYGELTIENFDYTKDSWLDRSWNGRDVKLLIGDPDWDYSNYRFQTNAISHELVSPDYNNLSLKIRDRSGDLDKDIKLRKFLGDSYEEKVESVDEEGVFTSEYNSGVAEGAFIPLAYGFCYQVPAILVDAQEHIYQVHDGPIQAVNAVYDRGLSVDFSASNALLSEGKFRLLAQPAGTITCDIQGAKFAGIDVTNRIVGDYFHWGDSSTFTNTTEGNLNNPTSYVTNASVTSHYRAYSQVGHVDGKYSVQFKVSAMDSGEDFRIGITNGLPLTTTGTLGDNSGEWSITGSGDKYVEGVLTADVIPELLVADVLTLEINLDDGEVYARVNNDVPTLLFSSTELTNLNACFICVSVAKGSSNPTTLEVNSAAQEYAFNYPFTNFWDEYSITGRGGLGTQPDAFYSDPANIIYDIVRTWSDLEPEYIDLNSLQTFQNNNQQPMGLWISDARPLRDILSEITRSYLASWGFNREGRFILFNIANPDSVSVTNDVNINYDEVYERGVNIKSRIIPTSRVDIGYKRFYKTQEESELAGGVLDNAKPTPTDGKVLWMITAEPNAGGGFTYTFGTPQPKESVDYSKEYRIETIPNRYAKIKHKLSRESDQLDTVLVQKADATRLARNRVGLFGELRTVFTFKLKKLGFNIDIGDIINIDFPRYGFDGGKNCLVVGISESHNPLVTILDVFT